MGPQGQPPPDARIAELAAGQHGVVSIRQLDAHGIAGKEVTRRVRAGRLHRVHRGVYAAGHPGLTLEGRFMAAVLASGRGAVLSHFSAAAHWGFVRWHERHPEVTFAGSGTLRVAGIRVHRTRTAAGLDVLCHRGIPVTSPARTLLDLAVTTPVPTLRAAARRAQAAHQTSVRRLLVVAERCEGHPGTGRLRAAVADGPAPTRSAFEDLVLDLLDTAGMQRPRVNAKLRLDGRTIIPDFLWPAARLVVEADGAAWHDHELARRDDADRQAILEAHGYRVLRITWSQTVARPEQTLARIRAALG